MLRTYIPVLTFVLAIVVANIAVADQITLTSGETLQGQVVERTDEHVVLSHALLGELTIANDAIADVQTEEAKPAEVAAPPVEEAAAEEPEAAPKPSWLSGWESKIEVGLSGTTGNTENASGRAAFTSKRETDANRTSIDASYLYATADGDRTQNKATAGLLHDWLLPDSPWFYFAQARGDYDEFAGWDARVTGAGGVGYMFVDAPELQISGRLGAAATREFGSDNDEVRPEGYIGGELLWKLNSTQTLSLSSTLYPDLSDLNQFRAVSAAAWTLALDQARGLSLKLGLNHEYESNPSDDAENSDLTYYSSLVFEF